MSLCTSVPCTFHADKMYVGFCERPDVIRKASTFGIRSADSDLLPEFASDRPVEVPAKATAVAVVALSPSSATPSSMPRLTTPAQQPRNAPRCHRHFDAPFRLSIASQTSTELLSLSEAA